MIIDLLNFCRYYPGTEANILFRLQESGIRIPSFFCITKDYTEDELNNYLQNHFQHTTHFTLRLSLSYEEKAAEELVAPEKEPPHYVNIPKSIMVRYADRLFSEAKAFVEQNYPDKDNHSRITAHVIVQEMVHSTVFGEMQTVCALGILNETMITIGTGHNSDFTERGVPFSIYCHNDTDNILFAHEPEGAMKADRSLLGELLRLSERLKTIFHNCGLTVKFVADYDANKLFLLSVQKIIGLCTEDDEIILDTRGVSNYYPAVTEPLCAFLAMELSKSIIRRMFKYIGHESAAVPELLELIEYVNGRLYYNTKRLHRLQAVLSFHDDMEEYVNRSYRLLFKNLFGKQRLLKWRRQRNIAVNLQKVLEENLKQREIICKRLSLALDEITSVGNLTTVTKSDINSALRKAVSSLSDCLCANLFNTLYINMNRKLLAHCKPGDKKYAIASERIESALLFRKELRVYHGNILNHLVNYAKRTGEAFVAAGTFDNADDIFMLTYEETLSLKDGNIKEVRTLIETRKRELNWYRSMPGFTSLIFSGKVKNALVGKVDFVDVIKENCHFRGSGTMPGSAVMPAAVCSGGLPSRGDPKCIYVVKKLPESIPDYNIGGLIIEEPAVFANLLSYVAECRFPIISGAEHACTLIKDGDLIDMNGTSGEITVSCQRNINF